MHRLGVGRRDGPDDASPDRNRYMPSAVASPRNHRSWHLDQRTTGMPARPFGNHSVSYLSQSRSPRYSRGNGQISRLCPIQTLGGRAALFCLGDRLNSSFGSALFTARPPSWFRLSGCLVLCPAPVHTSQSCRFRRDACCTGDSRYLPLVAATSTHGPKSRQTLQSRRG